MINLMILKVKKNVDEYQPRPENRPGLHIFPLRIGRGWKEVYRTSTSFLVSVLSPACSRYK
jgi:hypothetical protein